jgi:hypothetical protein
MLERLEAVFCEVDDFCKALQAPWAAHLIGCGAQPRGPEPGLADSEIITLLLALHSAGYKHLKHFYNGPMGSGRPGGLRLRGPGGRRQSPASGSHGT